MTAMELPDLLALSRRVIDGGDITRDEARVLFELDPRGEDIFDLFYAAHKVRRHFHGNRVTFCSILPTKFGNCTEDCKFCAQSAHFDTGITPHSMMDGDTVKQAVRDARDRGAMVRSASSTPGAVRRAARNGRRSWKPSTR